MGPNRAGGRQGRPRVVHLTTSHRADDVRIFERECRSLAASGRYDVYLAAGGIIPSDAGVTLIPLAPPPRRRATRFTAGPLKALALTRTVDADLWHFHDPELLPVALLLARSGRAVVWDAHEDYAGQFDEVQGSKSWVPAPLRGVVRTGTQSLLTQIDRHAAGVVGATASIVSRYSNPRTTLVGNEARLELFAGCRPSFAARRVLFTGGAGPGHLFMEVVEAVAAVRGASLAVAGREPDPATWELADSILGDRIEHLGWLDRSGIVGAIGASSIGLSTYSDIPSHAENSPNKLFESGAAGLPVVATPTLSNVRYLGESGGGVVASGFTAGDIADAISTLLDDEPAWQAASHAGRVWAAREGSWTASETRLLGLYESILEGSHT